MSDLSGIERRIDELTVPLLVPLRTTKLIDGVVFADLLAVGKISSTPLSGLRLCPSHWSGRCGTSSRRC
jgi:hypothetical protein